jgi:hypothetical protein
MRVIDDTVGQPFDLLLEDFDNDGNIDLLVTAFNNKIGISGRKLGKSGSVYIYEIPDDLLYNTISITIFFLKKASLIKLITSF